MQRKISKLLSVVLVAILCATAVIITACGNEKEFEFVTKPASATPSSNGGMAVAYGEYLYFVNGSQSSYSATNAYTGEPKSGDILRIKLADLKEIMDYNFDDTMAATLSEDIATAMYEKAEIVVPYFYYTGNTTTKQVNGLWIFGDKIYYTSPSTEVATNGAINSHKLDIVSVDLDGRNRTVLATLTNNSATVMFAQKGGKVYAIHTEGGLVSIDLSTKTSTTVAESITGTLFDVKSGTVYFIDKNENICQYEAGSADVEKVLENPDKNIYSYKILSENEGSVYYTKSDANDSATDFGILKAKKGEEEKTIFVTSSIESIACYGDKVIIASQITSATPVAYELFITSGTASSAETTFILPKNSNSETITLNKVEGNILYLTKGVEYYTVDLANGNEVTKVGITLSANGWYDIDEVVYDGTSYYFTLDNVGGINCNVYDEDSAVTSTITVVTPAEEE